MGTLLDNQETQAPKQVSEDELLRELELAVREFIDPLKEGEVRNPWPKVYRIIRELNRVREKQAK